METNEKFEMFFNCLVKMKYNLMYIGDFNMPKTSEIVNIIDNSIWRIYKVAKLENLKLEYELGKIEEYTDYPYATKYPENFDQYKKEVFKIVDHLLSHVKELREAFEKNAEYFIADVIFKIGDELYDYKLNF